MSPRTALPWLNYALGALCLGAIAAAVLVVGPSASSQTGVTRTAKVAEGVVQSTVSGSGNLAPASQLNLGFKTSGTVTAIYVKQGQYVTEGKLLATLDPQSAEVTLEQAKAALLSAEANLAREQETDGEASSGSAGNGSVGAADNSASAAVASAASVSATTPSTVPQQEAQPQRATEQTAEAQTEHNSKHETKRGTKGGHAQGGESSTATKPAETTTTPAKSTLSTATREANIASARANVKSDSLTVQNDEQAVAATKLFAPEDGTIVSLSGQVGEVVSASGTTRDSASTGSSDASSSGSSASDVSAASRGASGSGSSGSGSSGSGSSSAFAVLSDLSSMQLVVALSESEIGHVKVGQIATVTIEALEGRKLAAHVSEVATTSTSSSGVVSYDVTFTLDQMEAGLRPGMSATAEVVVKQEEGLNVPTSAIKGGSVTVARNGKDETRRVTTGLAGDSSTIVLSGLKAGETVVLPTALSTSSATSLTSRLSRLGGGGLGGGGAFPAGGGGPAFFRGGG